MTLEVLCRASRTGLSEGNEVLNLTVRTAVCPATLHLPWYAVKKVILVVEEFCRPIRP